MKKDLIKFFLLMKLTAFLCLITVFQVMAESSYSQTKKLSLSLENVSIKQVLKEIEGQSEFTFMYNDANINVKQKVSVFSANETIFEILDKVLNKSEISYQVLDKQIILIPKKKEIKAPKQNFKITGSVTDSESMPLPGATVVEKGTTNGTITDFDGKYSITVASGDAVLVFSFMGYTPKEVPLAGQTTINAVLRESVESLEEVVIVGYGKSSKKLLTSSISSVKSEDIERAVANGVQETLQGRTSGVQVVQNSGTPGAAISVNIRGKSSISAGTQPLYVIDGIPMTSGDYGQISFEGQGIDAIADINPNNIESISILKDASAAAIYGARAGNGVILITTKSGKKDKTRIDFKSYYGIQKVWRTLDMLDAEGWKEYVNTFDPGFVNGLDQSINTNWLDEVIRTAPIQNYELSIAGGEKKTRFYVSGRYFNQEGIVLGSAYEKVNGRVNIDHDITERLRVGVKNGINYSINSRIVGDQSINGVLPNAVSKPPVYAIKDEFGNYMEEGFWDNPVAIGNDVTNEARTLRNISNIYGEYDIMPGLRFKNQWGIDFYNLHERRYEPTTVDRGAESNGIAISARTGVTKITQQSLLTYMTSFLNAHNLEFLLGYSFEKQRERNNFIRGNNFPSDELEYITSAGFIEEASSGGGDFGLESVFGRAKYNFKDKYLIEFSVRRDGSSNFGEDNKYSVLPAGSFAWRLGEEDFIKGIDWLNELKFKASYGFTGNDNIGAFRARNLYSSGYNYYGNAGIIPTQIPNPELKWETTSNFNTGIDFALFNERIMFTSDFYYNETTDLLLNRPLPGTTGFTSVSSNVGSLENKGMEFSLIGVILNGEINWTSTFNISFNRNKILSLYEDQPITDQGRGGNAAFVDEPIGVFYMYKSLGVDPTTGDLVFEDVNNDGSITELDRTIVGDPNPDFTGGFNNNISYKNFNLSFMFQYSYGNDIFNGTRQYAEAMKFGTSDNQLATIKDRWQNPGDETYIPRDNGTYNNSPLSSHFIEDGSYVRLKEVTLGYSFPNELLKKTKVIQNARVFAKAQNLITFTPYSGMDPEVNYSGISALRAGTDFFTFPNARTFTVGIKLGF